MEIKLTRVLERWSHNFRGILVDLGEEPNDDQLDQVLQNIGAFQYAHAHGRSLRDHLTGTRNILRSWSQPFWIQAAGLFHSIYSTDVYRPQVLDIANRERLRAVIGKKAERLVYLFCSVSRYALFERLFESAASRPHGLITPMEISEEQSDLKLDSSEVFGLILIHMANEAEQSCLADGKPGVWLARVSALGDRLRKTEGSVPPVFDGCTKVFSPEDELLLRESYNKGLDVVCTDRAAAENHFVTCRQLCPWVAEPLILNAFLSVLEGRIAEARDLGLKATKILDQWRTAWDKRLSSEQWKRIAKVFTNQKEVEQISNVSPEFIKEPRAFFHRLISPPHSRSLVVNLPAVKSTAIALNNGSGGQLALTRLERYISSFADSRSDPRRAIYPELPSQPWYDPKQFPIVLALESAYKQISEEILRLPDQEFHSESEKISRKGAWNVFFFYERGKKNVENCSRCPTITAIIEQHETIRTQAGLIYVSRMRPGTHISPHRGPTNLRVRCHLGIQIPEGDCGLRVNHEIGIWSQGRCIVFDDFYEHEAWNYTKEDRIVLIVDLWHPALTPHEREVLKSLHRYAFVHAEGLQQYWAGNLKAKNDTLYDYH